MQLATHDAAAVHAVPLPDTPWCLFLDVDGTLLELAEHPQAVAVDEHLMPLLERVRGGPAARWRWSAAAPSPISTACSAAPTCRLPGCTAASGATRAACCTSRRWRSNSSPGCARGLQRPGRAASRPAARGQGRRTGAAFPQGAASWRPRLRAEVALLAAPLVPDFALLDGHAVIEVKPAAHTKDSAVTAFMHEEPFKGRVPIFIGDDQTDYGGFAAVRRFDGLAIAVGPRVKSEWWLPGPRRGASLARTAARSGS